MATHLHALEKQSDQLAAEIVRFQSFLHSLGSQSTDAAEAGGELPQSSPPTADTPQMGRCKIVCTLDGQERAVILYDKYADLGNRTFPNDRHAMPLHEYLSRRAKGMRWDAEPPRYEIVPAEE
jgi:hypothetical protein